MIGSGSSQDRDVVTGMAVSMHSLWFISLSIIPISIVCFLYGLRIKKNSIAVIAILVLLFMVMVLITLQYQDYQHLSQCVQEGKTYQPFTGRCVE